MTFLTPWSALLAAAVAVPLLVALYMLKLRRRVIRLPSTLLWKSVFEDLQANVPFQRLRWSWLLLLQMLLLLALLAAIAQPLLRHGGGRAARVILLIDRSASMNARLSGSSGGKPARTRLDAARDAARRIIDGLDERGPDGRIMIIEFAASPRVACNFQDDRALLRDAIDAIEPTDEAADFDAALQLAAAFAGSTEETDVRPPEVTLISDGAIDSASGPSGHSLAAGAFTFVQVAKPVSDSGGQAASSIDNVGIVSFTARRSEDDPSKAIVLARLVNAGPHAVELFVKLEIDGGAEPPLRKTVPSADAKGPGEVVFSQAIVVGEAPRAVVLGLRHDHADMLQADDQAWCVLPPMTRPRLALVHPADDDPVLLRLVTNLLDAFEPRRIAVMDPAGWAAASASEQDLAADFDLVIFDRVPVKRLPPVPTLTFGAAPGPLKAVDSADAASLRGTRMLSWDRQQPLMRSVGLDDLLFAGFDGYELPPGAVPLAIGPKGPVIASFRERGVRHVAVGFELSKSNWPLQYSIAVFMQNVLDDLVFSGGGAGATGTSGRDAMSHRPGETVAIRVRPGAKALHLDGPIRASIDADSQPRLTLPAIARAGLLQVEGAAPPDDRLAYNVASDVESDIRPRDSVVVNARSASARGVNDATGRPIWPWLVVAAIVLLTLEWLAYCRRSAGA